MQSAYAKYIFVHSFDPSCLDDRSWLINHISSNFFTSFVTVKTLMGSWLESPLSSRPSSVINNLPLDNPLVVEVRPGAASFMSSPLRTITLMFLHAQTFALDLAETMLSVATDFLGELDES